MPLNTNIDLQTIALYLGKSYKEESSGSSIISTINLSTGPVFSVSLARNLVSSYTNGLDPIPGSDFDYLNKLSSDLRSLEEEINVLYNTLKASYLSSFYSKVNTFFNNAYGENLRSYLNSNDYNSVTGPIWDIHGGFAKSYLDYNGNSLIFKLAEIKSSGPWITMTHGPLSYDGIGGLNKLVHSHFTGPVYNIVHENISTSLFTGPYNSVFEYGSTGSVCFNYILGNSGSFRTLAYPRILNAGFNAPTGSSQDIYFNNIAMSVTQEPIMRNANAANTLILKAKSVVDDGDRDFVFKMIKNDTNYPTLDDTEQTKTITVAGTNDFATIIGTTGNTSYYRPFSIVSAQGVQEGEVFEVWVQE